MARKCIVCDSELGEREQYCGNCRTKAPDGATDKEEFEFKHIIKPIKHEPRVDPFYYDLKSPITYDEFENIKKLFRPKRNHVSATKKCISCGAEIGDEESYCENCGTKPPDEALNKEKIEIKYATEEREEYPPWIFYTWKAQRFLFALTPGRYSRRNMSVYCFLMLRFLIIGIFIIIQYLAELKTISSFVGFIECIANIVFGIMFCIIWFLSSAVSNKLCYFKKDAPKFLYINCLIQAFIWWFYVGIISIIGTCDKAFIQIAFFEFVSGTTFLLITRKYYKKRKSAFIN